MTAMKTISLLIAVAAAATPREQLLQLLQQAPNSPATLAEVAGALGSLALEEKRDDGATIAALRNMITELTGAIEQQHTTAQTALNNQGNFQTCSDAKVEAFGEAAKLVTTTTTVVTTTGAPSTTTVHADLLACKAQEAELMVHNKTCHGELAASRSAKQATCALYDDMNYASAGAARIARCADSTLFSGAYEDFLERDIQILSTLRQRGQNCTDITAVYTTKSAECEGTTLALSNKMQECLNLEVMMAANNVPLTISAPEAPVAVQVNCGPWVAKVAACSNYEACYTSEVSMQQSAFSTASTLATSRQAEMTSLKRILCLLDVLEMPVGQQSSKLSECVAAVHDVGLVLTQPVAPAKVQCDPGAKPLGCAEL